MDANLIHLLFAFAVAVLVLYLIVIVARDKPTFYSFEGGKTIVLWFFLAAAILSGILAYNELKDEQQSAETQAADQG